MIPRKMAFDSAPTDARYAKGSMTALPESRVVPSPSGLTRGQAWLVAVSATLVMSVSYIDRQAMAALAGSVKTALALNHTQYGWTSSTRWRIHWWLATNQGPSSRWSCGRVSRAGLQGLT